MEEGEVEDAVVYYSRAGNLELRKINDNIRKVFKMFGGDIGEEEEMIDNNDDDDYEDIDVDVEDVEDDDNDEVR